MSEAAARRPALAPRGQSIAWTPIVIWLVIALVAISLPFWLLTSQCRSRSWRSSAA